MGPFKLSEAKCNTGAYQYLSSFGISYLITAPAALTLYCFYLWVWNRKFVLGNCHGWYSKQRHAPSTDRFRWYFSGTIETVHAAYTMSGVLWGLANFMSVEATFHLSMRVAFPLTQTAVLLATSWGISYFHEIELSQDTMLKITSGLSCFMIGSYLLASSST